MLAKTPVIQCSPCYSAVSALLMSPLPDHSNDLPHPLPHSGWINTSLVSSGQTLYQAALLETITAAAQNLVGKSGETQCLDKAEQQAEASVDVPYPPLQIVNSVPFVSFLSLSSLCSLSQSSLFSLSTIPFFLVSNV